MSSPAAVSSSGNTRFSQFEQNWIQTKLREMGKNSLAELSPAERVRLTDQAASESSKTYLRSILTAVGVGAVAIFVFPALVILGGFAFIGTAAFASDMMLIPIFVGLSAGVLFGIKKGTEHCPSLFNHYLVEPFQNASSLNNLNFQAQR